MRRMVWYVFQLHSESGCPLSKLAASSVISWHFFKMQINADRESFRYSSAIYIYKFLELSSALYLSCCL